MEATKVKEAEREAAAERSTEPQQEPPQTGDSGGFQWSKRSLIIALVLAAVAIGVVRAYLVGVSRSPSEETRVKPQGTETSTAQPDPNVVTTDSSQANDIKFE